MDAYSISYTTQSRRNSSRIYEDLQSIRLKSIDALDPEQIALCWKTMSAFNKRAKADPGRRPHVGVVGAGLAGLRCADLLLQYGFQVTVLEGRDRIGGRLHQEVLPNGHLVDVGANWIHGTQGNPILDLAKETKTTMGSWDTRSYMFDQSGKLLPLEESEKYAEIMWDIVQDAFKHSNRNCADIPEDESLLDFFHRELKTRIPDTELDYEKTRETVLQVADMWGAFVGSPLSRQSLKFFWLEECIEGENLFCAGTYQKVLKTIAEPVLEEAAVKYGRVVEKISYRVRRMDQVTVQTRAGEIFEFDEVVVAAPLGWLKRHLSAFEPALPGRLCDAINAIGYGNLEKVYITFRKAFWLTPDAEGRRVEGFCQWLAPLYAPESNPRRWNQEVVDMSSLTSTTSHPTLLFYIYGEESEYVVGKLAELDSKEKEAFVFDFFRPYYSRLPHYAESDPECQPTGHMATAWLRDELAGCGSYSNFQVGLRDGDWDVKVMREGLPEGGLWLAGEHTAPYVALGTVTGAYWSGECAGRRIAEAYGLAG